MGKKFLAAMNTSVRDVIQSAAYGLGLVAQYAPAQFKEILPATIEALAKVIQEKDSRSEEKAIATECAIGAVGKIVLFNYDGGIVGQTMVQQYLALLPLKAESEEAQNVHRLFFKSIIGKHQVLLLPANIPAVKDAIARIHDTAKAEPALEIIKTEDVPLLEQCINLLK